MRSFRFEKAPPRWGCSFDGARRVTHDLLKHIEILQVAFAALARNLAERLRAIVLKAFDDLNEPRLFQHLKMPAEIAVGDIAELLEIAEQQPFRVRHKRGEHAQTHLFVDHTIK